MRTVTLSLVNYNTRDHLARALRALGSSTATCNLRVWVVDNASSDGSAAMVRGLFPSVRLIVSPRNVGFGTGHNLVLRQAQTDYCLLLNPDAELPAGGVDTLVSFMDAHPRCAIAGPRLVDFAGQPQPNGGDFPVGLALYAWLFNLRAPGLGPDVHRRDAGYYRRARAVDWVGGSCMMLRTEALRAIGLFDEAYFLAFEDVDLCYRAGRAGYTVMVEPSVVVRHQGGASSRDPRYWQWSGDFTGVLRFYGRHRGERSQRRVRRLVRLAIVARIVAFSLLGRRNAASIYRRILGEI